VQAGTRWKGGRVTKGNVYPSRDAPRWWNAMPFEKVSHDPGRQGRVYYEVLIALDENAAPISRIKHRIKAQCGSMFCDGSVYRALRVAMERGCAIKNQHGYREPSDALSEGRFAAELETYRLQRKAEYESHPQMVD
jgi:hypothetical protein